MAKRKYTQEGLFALIRASFRFAYRSINDTILHIRNTIWLWLLEVKGQMVTRESVTLNLKNDYIAADYKLFFRDGVPEREELETIRTHLSPDADVIELGGSIGFISCSINEILNDGRIHIVMEANKRLIETLEENRDYNGCTFDIRNEIYAPGVESAELHVSESFLESSRNQERAERSTSPGEYPVVETIDVPATDLRRLLSEYGLDRFVLVADIEGAEAALIESELDVLEAHCEMLFLEFHLHPELRERVQQARDDLEATSFTLVEENKQRDTLCQCVYANSEFA